jgi:DHA2 family multidrug resistance protein
LIGTVALLALSNFMAILDLTIVNVIVPHIAGSLAVSPNESTWVITSYAVAEAVTVPLAGWLAVRFGAVRVFVLAVLAFGLCSLACGLSQTLPMLLFFRVLQGVSGGPLMPMSQILIMHVTPPARVQIALGVQTMTTVVAPILGPMLGGLQADALGWQWAFYINIPIAVFSAVFVWGLLKTRETGREKNPIDYVGLALLVAWVSALQIMLDMGQNEDWFASPFILALAIVAALGFVAFLIWELTDRHPIVDLTVFRTPSFGVMAATAALLFAPFFAAIVLISLWLQTCMGYTATWAGYVIAFQGVLAFVGAPIVAQLISRIDPRLFLSAGIFVLAAAMLWRTTFDLNVTFWQLAGPQFMTGLAIALFGVPLVGLPVVVVPPSHTGAAASLINFIRTLAAAIGTAVGITLWERAAAGARTGLSGVLHGPGALLDTMKDQGLSAPQSLEALDRMVDAQALMIATNNVYLLVGVLLAALSAAIWLMPRPTTQITLRVGGH